MAVIVIYYRYLREKRRVISFFEEHVWLGLLCLCGFDDFHRQHFIYFVFSDLLCLQTGAVPYSMNLDGFLWGLIDFVRSCINFPV